MVFRFEIISITIQTGASNIIDATIKPRGLIFRASTNCPLNKDNTERVEPQEGQGIFVTCLMMQTSKAGFIESNLFQVKNNQAYPIKQAINTMVYSLFLLRFINTIFAVVFLSFSHG